MVYISYSFFLEACEILVEVDEHGFSSFKLCLTSVVLYFECVTASACSEFAGSCK